MASRDQAAAGRSARSNNSNRQSHIFCIENGLQPHHAARLKVALEEVSNEFRVLLNDVKRAVFDPITEWNCATHPDASLFRGSDFVPDALARNFAFELRERKQHVEGEPSHAGGGVESLGHRDERDIVFVEQLDQLGEVGQRPCQPVDLVDDDDVHPAGANVVQQLCQGGPVH